MKAFLRKRKNKQLPVEKTYKIVTFQLQQLQQLWFGFPLRQVLKVIIGQQQYYNNYQNSPQSFQPQNIQFNPYDYQNPKQSPRNRDRSRNRNNRGKK